MPARRFTSRVSWPSTASRCQARRCTSRQGRSTHFELMRRLLCLLLLVRRWKNETFQLSEDLRLHVASTAGHDWGSKGGHPRASKAASYLAMKNKKQLPMLCCTRVHSLQICTECGSGGEGTMHALW